MKQPQKPEKHGKGVIPLPMSEKSIVSPVAYPFIGCDFNEVVDEPKRVRQKIKVNEMGEVYKSRQIEAEAACKFFSSFKIF